MKTAEEYFDFYSRPWTCESYIESEWLIDKKSFKLAMIEFAKIHVKVALIRAHSNSQLPEEDLCFTLNAYPETLIK